MISLGSLWLDLTADVARLCLEAQTVVGLRLLGAVGGQIDVRQECVLMVVEKGKASWDTQALIADCVVAGEAHLVPTRVVALYRRRVRANAWRLSRSARRVPAD